MITTLFTAILTSLIKTRKNQHRYLKIIVLIATNSGMLKGFSMSKTIPVKCKQLEMHMQNVLFSKCIPDFLAGNMRILRSLTTPFRCRTSGSLNKA